MANSAQATDVLVERVRRLAEGSSPAALRDALTRVLAELDVVPGDPAWADGRDVVGAAYERLLPGRARRPLGQFFTPLGVGRAMARWLFAQPAELLLDPGCGSGSLLVAAAQEHVGRTRLLGLDVDPIAIEMAAANGRLRRISQLELRRTDFLVDDFEERPGAIICNPPYTRHHALSSELKATIHRRLQARFGIEFSRLASLHVLFLARALDVSEDDARLAFVTPAHWLDMNYARSIKTLLLERAHVEAIVRFPAEQLVFENAATTATITLIRKGLDGDGTTRLFDAKASTAEAITAALANPDRGERLELTSTRKWSRPGRRRRGGVRLGAVARVHRGVATGCNAFFVLSEQERRECRLALSSVTRCIASPKWFDGRSITRDDVDQLPETAPRWLLTPSKPRHTGPLAGYLARGRDEFRVLDCDSVRKRVRAGRPWYELELPMSAPILFTYLNKQRPRFVRNEVDGIPLNNWLIVKPNDDVDADVLFSALTDRRVASQFMDECRVYGGGLWKLEPRELENLVLPVDQRNLTA